MDIKSITRRIENDGSIIGEDTAKNLRCSFRLFIKTIHGRFCLKLGQLN
ncbi:hypothetical protein NBRC111894_2546 [Sporolactobacillus inulinus]|uniref:Uncharacterized protein n=1 Tax=Sporolactobacillus inulinus TaxID=2078 RepID=A0A4Y1ZD14_9BACL|nr:hypothetical protein NBRC111894_2546 [Sporolactobacillus inulinus]